MSHSSVFIDAFDNVTLADGVIRFDLITVAPGAANAQPVATKVGSIGIPIQGFLRTTEQFNQVINKMVEQGILNRTDPPATIEGAAATVKKPKAS